MTLPLYRNAFYTEGTFTEMLVVSRQVVTFVGVGVACAVIDIGLMVLLIFAGLHHVTAATFGFVAGLILNFALHTKVTFSSQYSHKILVKFIAVVTVNYLLTIMLVGISFEWLGSAVVGKVISLPMVAVNGFLLSKYWIYK